MGAHRDKANCAAARTPFFGLSVLIVALGYVTTDAYAVEIDNAEQSNDTWTQSDNPEQSTPDTAAPNFKEGWLGFGRNFLKPGNLTSENPTPDAADPLSRRGGSGRLENSSGTTAWFDINGFNDRGKYQLFRGWTFTPGFELRESFTDNVALRAHNGFLPANAPPGAREDFITELNPAIKLIGDERRLKFQLRYLAQSLIYANNTELSDVRHRLFSAAQAELLPQFLFFDGSLSIYQQNTFSTGRGITSNYGPGTFLGGVGDNLNFVGDRTDVLTYNLSPYIRTRLRNFATAELRYTYSDFAPISESQDGQNSFSSSLTRGYRALIESGPSFTRLKWRFGYDRRDSDFSSGRVFGEQQFPAKNVFQKYFASLDYYIIPQVAALGTVGYEDNDFANNLFNNQRPRGVIWDIGGRWAPSIRTSVQATYGQRFFGDRYFLEITHRAQHALININYIEEPTLGALLSQAGANCGAGGFSVALTGYDGRSLNCAFGAGASNQNADVFIRRLFSASATYTGLRNDLTLQFFKESREYTINRNSDQDLLGITGIWTHSLTPDSAMDVAVTWTDIQAGTTSQTTVFNSPGQVWNYSLNLNHRLSQTVAALVGFRRIDRTADDPNQDYSENRVFAGLRINY